MAAAAAAPARRGGKHPHHRRSDWADIAYALGYSSQQHFITDFRTVLGETPVQYKANLSRRAQ